MSNSSRSMKNSKRSNGPSNCGNFIWYEDWFTIRDKPKAKKHVQKMGKQSPLDLVYKLWEKGVRGSFAGSFSRKGAKARKHSLRLCAFARNIYLKREISKLGRISNPYILPNLHPRGIAFRSKNA